MNDGYNLDFGEKGREKRGGVKAAKPMATDIGVIGVYHCFMAGLAFWGWCYLSEEYMC